MNLEVTKANMEKRGFVVKLFETAAEAAEYLNQQIDGTDVAFGGSVTVTQMGLFESIGTHNKAWSHGVKEQLEEYGRDRILTEAMSTEVYISSVNAISEEGQLVNIDGTGNRLASNCFGHKRLYLVAGKNKLAPNFHQALWRAQNIASPLNAKRLNKKTPCAAKGDKCYNCDSPERICRGYLIWERPMTGQKTEVILINEDLGY